MALVWLWLGAALVLAVVEVLTVAFFAAFLAAGAVVAGVAAALGLPLAGQAIVFLGVSLLGIVVLRPALMRRFRRPVLISGAQGMIGETAVVVQAIGDSHHPGHVRIAGESWPAVTADGTAIAAGETVLVIDIHQATLVVTPD